MTKVCMECGYRIPEDEQAERLPMEEPEDCPKCGASGTVTDEDEAGGEEAAETES